jgi:hypothetical protein
MTGPGTFSEILMSTKDSNFVKYHSPVNFGSNWPCGSRRFEKLASFGNDKFHTKNCNISNRNVYQLYVL